MEKDTYELSRSGITAYYFLKEKIEHAIQEKLAHKQKINYIEHVKRERVGDTMSIVKPVLEIVLTTKELGISARNRWKIEAIDLIYEGQYIKGINAIGFEITDAQKIVDQINPNNGTIENQLMEIFSNYRPLKQQAWMQQELNH